MENLLWPTGCWRPAARWRSGIWKTSCWIIWIWRGREASPLRPGPLPSITPLRTGRRTRSTSSIRRDMWTSTTRSAGLSPPARGRCWWWTPVRALRRRRWPTPIWRWTTIWRSGRWSTKSICLPPTRSGLSTRSRILSGSRHWTRRRSPRRWGLTSPPCWRTWCSMFPPPPETPTPPCGPSSLTATTTPTRGLSSTSGSWTGR